ncbi:WXG100 family type VII secretion target [Mycobacterium sp. Y57]|uniref:WXG100 family type VII secretion target n=1 Tax=Mycolicibacterium xanthum TaxID=2796469 RepID=UPI001C85E8A2|nr:WXG100 family type VII secretion target [Mycolicibacterium xanthum]MBX7432182.1 WXG100 family type VII secretion target [Mycolicibacterium xanthum]
MTTPSHPMGAALTTDFDLMLSVAGRTDARNDEIRGMLQSFIGAMTSVPPSVWGGVAAARFREVVERWNGESLRLHTALQRISDTIRDNERVLRTAADTHSQRIDALSAEL